jgi:adenylate cyclase
MARTRRRARACDIPSASPVVRPSDEQVGEPFFHATGAVCNLESLSDAAGYVGILNAAPDADGILRRVPMLVEYDGSVYPSLSLAAVAMATSGRPSAVRVANVNNAALLIDAPPGGRDRTVALDGKSNLLLRYRGAKRSFPYYSAGDVLAGRANPKTFANKIVFVGTTALGTREVVATPIDTLFAGVEIHATAADNLLQGDFLSRPEHRVALETQLVIGLGVLATLFFLRFGLMWGLLATGGQRCGAVGHVVHDAVDERDVPLAALPDDGLQLGACRDDRGWPARRTSTRGQVGARRTPPPAVSWFRRCCR